MFIGAYTFKSWNRQFGCKAFCSGQKEVVTDLGSFRYVFTLTYLTVNWLGSTLVKIYRKQNLWKQAAVDYVFGFFLVKMSFEN